MAIQLTFNYLVPGMRSKLGHIRKCVSLPCLLGKEGIRGAREWRLKARRDLLRQLLESGGARLSKVNHSLKDFVPGD